MACLGLPAPGLLALKRLFIETVSHDAVKWSVVGWRELSQRTTVSTHYHNAQPGLTHE